MPGAKPLPASLRHLKAKLKILRRPTVLGSVSVLLLAAWFLGDYWQQSFNRNTTLDNRVNSRSIDPSTPDFQPTPLDPLSSVDNPLAGENPSLPASSALESPTASDPFLTSLPKTSQPDATQHNQSFSWQSPFSSSRSATASASPNPLAEVPEINAFPRSSPTPTDNSLTTGNATSGNPSSGFSANPLQSALDRHAPSDPAAIGMPSSAADSSPVPGSSTATSQPNSSLSTTPGQFYIPQPLPGQPAPTQTLVQPQYVPQTSPAVGTTGYTMPSSLQTPGGAGATTNRYTPYSPLPSSQPSQSIVPTLPNSAASTPNLGAGYPATAQPQFTTPPSNPAPFSVPRSAPGQSIGGGQINTFSNP